MLLSSSRIPHTTSHPLKSVIVWLSNEKLVMLVQMCCAVNRPDSHYLMGNAWIWHLLEHINTGMNNTSDFNSPASYTGVPMQALYCAWIWSICGSLHTAFRKGSMHAVTIFSFSPSNQYCVDDFLPKASDMKLGSCLLCNCLQHFLGTPT